ncbi:MAG: glycosyltransferase family 2 protein [Chloroflexi bacterium]|nr:glycosyltransferase family 2 protein [Chloroflexota bacterium]
MAVTRPLVSIITPTLNSARTLESCLLSITEQTGLDGSVEIIIVDAGSTDTTRQIAERFGARILENPLRTGEAGKAVAARAAEGDFLAFIDSDNILVGRDWLVRMLAPFKEEDIAGSEPIRYLARPHDNYLTRYFASLGMNDPICLYLGNYDRVCALTGRWTEMPIRSEARDGYEKVWLTPGHVPTIGANGFVIRRRILMALGFTDHLFDVDVVQELTRQRHWAFAKIHCGIVHIFAGDVRTFRRKQRRRVRDYLHYRDRAMRSRATHGPSRKGLIHFYIATVLGWPLVWQALRGYRRTGDAAWLFHPAACALTLYEYGVGTLASRWCAGPLTREGWSQ